MSKNSEEIAIVGGGLAGTLVALELERRGQVFRIFDREAGAKCSRVAAGILNPLIGPRLSQPDFDWSMLEAHYREIESRWAGGHCQSGSVYHPLEIFRPRDSLLSSGPELGELQGPGWKAHKVDTEPGWLIQGGAWLDIPLLIDQAHQRFKQKGLLEERFVDYQSPDLANHRVVWCQGASIFDDQSIMKSEGKKIWQAVSGEILTVSVPGWDVNHIRIGTHFVLPLGNGLFRVGATHQADNGDGLPTAEGRRELEEFLGKLCGLRFTLIAHEAGVRPATRTYQPVVAPHPNKSGWFIFNGFGGRGASRMVAQLPRLMTLLGA